MTFKTNGKGLKHITAIGRGSAQQGRPAPIDLFGSKKEIIDGILGHLVYMGHHPNDQHNLSHIVKSLERPTSWWEKLFGPLMGGGSETVVSGMAV